MKLFSRSYWARIMARRLLRRGYVKIPSGMGGISTGGFLGFTNLGSREEQCKAYQHHVYKCVTAIYTRAITVPMRLYKERGEEDEEIKRHPFIDLMKRPNPYMSGRFLKAMTFIHLDLTGMAFWLKIYNSLKRPVELWPLSPANFQRFVLNEAKTDLVAYEFRSEEGRPIMYKPEDIVYFHYPHPLYMLEGASPVQAMAYAYDTDLAMRVYQRRFFHNSARADVVFETEQRMDEADAKRLLMAWKEEHQGVQQSWEPAILDNGLKAHILSQTAKDFEFATLAKWTKQDILEAYRVPEGKLGTVTDVNRANAVGIDITFNSECIAPRLDLYEEVVTMSLIVDYDTGLYSAHENAIPRDLDYDLKERETNLKYHYTSINEERAKDGLDPVAWGDAPFVQISEIQWGEEPGIVRESRQIKAGGQKEKGQREDRRRLAHERRVASRSRAYRAYLRRFFRAQKEEVLERLEALYPRIDGAIAGMSAKKAKRWLEEHKDLVSEINIDINVANKDLIQGSGPYLEGAIIAGGEEVLDGLGVDIAFDIQTPHVARFLKEKEMVLRDVNRVTHEAIQRELTEGFEAGESMQQMAARIREVFGGADRVRSLRIAQTEINSCVNSGTLEGYRQSGIVERKEWLAAPDARETHLDAMARYTGDGAIPIDEDFQVGNGSGPSPGNIGLPEEDIN